MIIGTRTLFVKTPDGEKEVLITVSMPIPMTPYDPSSPHWECHYEINWPEGRINSWAGGNDALHALAIAESKIAMEIYMSKYHHEQTMWWMKPWVGYGFALPKGARDLMIGDDQRFFGDAPLSEPKA